jgi:alpha-1,3-mannosyltransferase
LATRQAKKFDVTILTLDRVFGNPERLPRFEQRDGFAVRRIPFIGIRRLFLPFVPLGILRDYDVVHVHAADQLLDMISAMTRVQPTTRLFMTTHGLFFHTETLAGVKRVYLRTITKGSLSRCRAVFAVSGNDAETLRRVGVDSVVLRNPIVPLGDVICAGSDLLYVGRLSANKRVDVLIAFMAALRAIQPQTKLHIVGSDSEQRWPALADEVKRRGLEDIVHYHGFLDSKALVALAQACGFVVSASRFEGFGLSVVEGMSLGLLPCLHANEAFREIQQLSGCGILTNFDAPDAAAHEFADWTSRIDPSERTKAAHYAHAQSWDAVAETYAQHYRAP